jgi:transposase
MIQFGEHTRVYLAVGHTDMRKSINGLSVLVEDVFHLDPLSSHLFVFCNRHRDKLKILYWHNNGFWLFYRRLEKQQFWWPTNAENHALQISSRELSWLLDGLDINQVCGHKPLNYLSV